MPKDLSHCKHNILLRLFSCTDKQPARRRIWGYQWVSMKYLLSKIIMFHYKYQSQLMVQVRSTEIRNVTMVGTV